MTAPVVKEGRFVLEGGAIVEVRAADGVVVLLGRRPFTAMTPKEARAFAREMLACADAVDEIPRTFLPEPRHDGSSFDAHPLDVLAGKSRPLACGRDGCGHVFEVHESGRCTARVNVGGDRGYVPCNCLGFVGEVPEGRGGHVPVSAR